MTDPDPAPEQECWDTYPDTHTPAAPDTDLNSEPEPADSAGPRRVPVDVEVQVVVSLATWLGLDREPGLLRGYGAIDANTIDDIITTAQATGATTSLRRLFCDPTDGRLVQMDSTARKFTGTLRQFTTWRDHTDRLTGDTIADIDHIHDHHHHGPTAAHNGQGLSRRTHTLKDHPRVHAKTKPDRPWGDGLDHHRHNAPDIDWTLPNGTTHTSRPPPALGPGSDPTDHAVDAEWLTLLRDLPHEVPPPDLAETIDALAADLAQLS